MTDAKHNILAKIRRALQVPTDKPPVPAGAISEVFYGRQEDLISQFRRELEAIQGHFIYCAGKDELLRGLTAFLDQKGATIACYSQILRDHCAGIDHYAGPGSESEWADLLARAAPGNDDDAHIGITDCECLLARTGTVIMSSGQLAGRVLPVYVPVHVVIATVRQLVYDMDDMFDARGDLVGESAPSALYFISGPSRTGDIEKTLVLGVHGPLELFVFLVNDNLEQ